MVSYYRDPLNPEAVHFPAKLSVVATYLSVSLALLVTVILILIYGRGTDARIELAVTLTGAAALALSYPPPITTDEDGIHRGGRWAVRKCLIRWQDIESVRERAAVYGLPPFDTPLLANWVVEIRPVSGQRPIRFTCRHSGRQAFLQALKRWGAPSPALRNPHRRSR